MNLTRADVEEILKILDASPFDELEIETDRFKLVLRRSATPAGGWTETREVKSAAKPAVVHPKDADPAAPPMDDGTLQVRAPPIGTFYLAPQPRAPPDDEVGSAV